MASILDRYGIKEVADVVFWDIKDNKPVLYLDTLKVSTIEETAEQTEARGGKGNPPLIIWDYGKEITITLEDALFSMKSMNIMHNFKSDVTTVSSIDRAVQIITNANSAIPSKVGTITVPSDCTIYDERGRKYIPEPSSTDTNYFTSLAPCTKYLASWIDSNISDAQQIVVTSQDFPGTYRITGDTYARSQDTGEDEFFQFEIQQAKINPEQTITMQAEGDPSTFSMTVRVMRPADGKMMKLTKYSIVEPKVEYAIEYGTGESSATILVAAGGKADALAPKVTPEGATYTWTFDPANAPAQIDSNNVVSVTSGTATDTEFTVTATLTADPTKTLTYNFKVGQA